MTEREQLIEALQDLLDLQGRSVVVAPGATESDIRWMIRHWTGVFHRGDAETRRTAREKAFKPSGIHAQIGGDRLQVGRNGIYVRPAVDYRRGLHQ